MTKVATAAHAPRVSSRPRSDKPAATRRTPLIEWRRLTGTTQARIMRCVRLLVRLIISFPADSRPTTLAHGLSGVRVVGQRQQAAQGNRGGVDTGVDLPALLPRRPDAAGVPPGDVPELDGVHAAAVRRSLRVCWYVWGLRPRDGGTSGSLATTSEAVFPVATTDNNFIATTTIGRVSPGEHWSK